jgi:hypothetical protein
MWGSAPDLWCWSGCSCSPGPRGPVRGRGWLGVSDGRRGMVVTNDLRCFALFTELSAGRAGAGGDPAQPCCLGGNLCPNRARCADSPGRPSKNLRYARAAPEVPAREFGIGRLPGSPRPAAWPCCSAQPERLDNHRTPSGAVVIVERTDHGRTRGPGRPTRSSFCVPRTKKNKRMKIPRPGAPAQPGPGARSTTLLTSPGPDGATANRPPKPGGPHGPRGVGRLMAPSRRVSRPTPL